MNKGMQTLLVFFAVLALGLVAVEALPLGYTEATLVYLSAVVGAGLFWAGRDR